MKEVCSLLTGIPIEDFEKEEVKNSYLGNVWNWTEECPDGVNGDLIARFEYRMTVRSLMQKVGTDCMRDNLHPDTWVNALFADYKNKWTENPKW